MLFRTRTGKNISTLKKLYNYSLWFFQPFKPFSWLGSYLTSLLAVWFPLWQSAKAHSHPYADDELGKLGTKTHSFPT